MSEKIAAAAPREPADAPALASRAEPVPPEDAAQAPASAPAAQHPLEAIVDRWFAESFHGSHLARDTHAWNLVYGAAQDLKRRLVRAT